MTKKSCPFLYSKQLYEIDKICLIFSLGKFCLAVYNLFVEKLSGFNLNLCIFLNLYKLLLEMGLQSHNLFVFVKLIRKPCCIQFFIFHICRSNVRDPFTERKLV